MIANWCFGYAPSMKKTVSYVSFWGLCPQTLTGGLPLDPAGWLPSPRPLGSIRLIFRNCCCCCPVFYVRYISSINARSRLNDRRNDQISGCQGISDLRYFCTGAEMSWVRSVLTPISVVSEDTWIPVDTRFWTANSYTSIYINATVAWDDVCDSYFQNMSSASGGFAPKLPPGLRQPSPTCRTAFPAQHLRPLGVLSCWPDGLEHTPGFYPFGIQRAAQTVLGVYLKRTCWRFTGASSALGVLNDYALYKSTHLIHLLTHSLTHPTGGLLSQRPPGSTPVDNF